MAGVAARGLVNGRGPHRRCGRDLPGRTGYARHKPDAPLQVIVRLFKRASIAGLSAFQQFLQDGLGRHYTVRGFRNDD